MSCCCGRQPGDGAAPGAGRKRVLLKGLFARYGCCSSEINFRFKCKNIRALERKKGRAKAERGIREVVKRDGRGGGGGREEVWQDPYKCWHLCVGSTYNAGGGGPGIGYLLGSAKPAAGPSSGVRFQLYTRLT